MTPERARELAIAILFGMVGNNDEIANDPSRWGDPLQSFSFDEVAVKIEEAILQACAEEREACAKKCDSYADDRRAMQKKTGKSYYEGAADAADELGTAIRGAK